MLLTVLHIICGELCFGGGCVLRYAVLCCVGGGDGGGGLSDTVLVFHSGLSLTSSGHSLQNVANVLFMGVTALNLLPHRASISLPGSQFPGAFSTSPFQICHPPPFIFLVNPSSNLAFPLFPSFSTADFNTFCCPCYLSYNLFAAFPVSP